MMGGQAFDAPRLQAFFLDPNDVTIVGLDTDEGPEHPLYDPRIQLEVEDSDVANVLAHGIIKPGIARKERLTGGGERVVVIDGRQRTRWARLANARLAEDFQGDEYERRMVRVPFMVRQLGDSVAQTRLKMAANHHKESSPMLKAQEAQVAINRGMSVHDIAVSFGVQTKVVRGWLSLLDMSDEVQRAVLNGKISASAAQSFGDLSHEEQRQVLADAAAEGRSISTGDAQRAAKARKQQTGAKRASVPRAVAASTLRALTQDEVFFEGLSDGQQALLAWICGDKDAARYVEGLLSALQRANTSP